MSLEDWATADAKRGRLSDDEEPRLVGESRIEAAHLAERERCAQVPEAYILELRTAPECVIDALNEVALRIRNRPDFPR